MSIINQEISEMAEKMEKSSMITRSLENTIRQLGAEGLKKAWPTLTEEQQIALKDTIASMLSKAKKLEEKLETKDDSKKDSILPENEDNENDEESSDVEKASKLSLDPQSQSGSKANNKLVPFFQPRDEERQFDEKDEELAKLAISSGQAEMRNQGGVPVEGWEGQVIKGEKMDKEDKKEEKAKKKLVEAVDEIAEGEAKEESKEHEEEKHKEVKKGGPGSGPRSTGKVEIQQHPKEVADVDPKIIEGMKERLKEKQPEGKREPKKDIMDDSVQYSVKKADMQVEETLQKKAPKGVDPAKHERCVKEVKTQGHDVGSAHAICTASMKKSLITVMERMQERKLEKSKCISALAKNLECSESKLSEIWDVMAKAKDSVSKPEDGQVEPPKQLKKEEKGHKVPETVDTPKAKEVEAELPMSKEPKTKADEPCPMKKSSEGEGSRGGKVIGHTKSGKPIYDVETEHKHTKALDYSMQDHMDAAKLHGKSGSRGSASASRAKWHSDQAMLRMEPAHYESKSQLYEKLADEPCPMKKSSEGEGSRGGKVIGHTKSGKPIYDVETEHKHTKALDYSMQDHMDAAKLHGKSGSRGSASASRAKWHSDQAMLRMEPAHYESKSQLYEKLADESCPMKKSFFYEEDSVYTPKSDDMFKSNVFGKNCHYSVDSYIESVLGNETVNLKKSNGFGESLKKSEKKEDEKKDKDEKKGKVKVDINDMLEEKMDKSSDDLKLWSENQSCKTGSFLVKSFNDSEMDELFKK